jgi:hypothetical protein
VFKQLLRLVPNLTERLMEASEQETMIMADLVCRPLQRAMELTSLSFVKDSKGYIQCKVR